MSISSVTTRNEIRLNGLVRAAAKSFAIAASLFAGCGASAARADEAVKISTAYFEKLHVPPLRADRLRELFAGKTVTFKRIATGARERVYYGAQRVDERGAETSYRIADGDIEQMRRGVRHLLLVYEWQGRTYGCLENVGDLDALGDQVGLCPYEIVGEAAGNTTQGE